MSTKGSGHAPKICSSATSFNLLNICPKMIILDFCRVLPSPLLPLFFLLIIGMFDKKKKSKVVKRNFSAMVP